MGLTEEFFLRLLVLRARIALRDGRDLAEIGLGGVYRGVRLLVDVAR